MGNPQGLHRESIGLYRGIMGTLWGIHTDSIEAPEGLYRDSIGAQWGLYRNTMGAPWGIHRGSMGTQYRLYRKLHRDSIGTP